MTLTSKKTSLGIVTALGFMGLTAVSANAYYLGYDNGDATNESFWQEQGAEPIAPAQLHAVVAPRTHHRHHALLRHHIVHKSKSATG